MPPHFWYWAGLLLAALILSHLINRALDALFMDKAAEKIASKMQSES